MFSSRLPNRLEPNRVTLAVERARLDGRSLVDLTTTNPTRVGIAYPPEVLAPLASSAALVYDPHPFGLDSAREAVAQDFARRGVETDPSRVVLTASTSEAYSLLFKLLCSPDGDTVLVPAPSYPLFEHLTTLDGVRAVPYHLEYQGRWVIDWNSVDRADSDAVRAILAVSPNNPTGSVLATAELDPLSDRCAGRDAALILDEVFADYSLAGRSPVGSGWNPSCLTIRLGGLSKSAGLPQVKLGWMALAGPDALVGEALRRLELICDTYLSVSTPVQVAAPSLIASGSEVRSRILARVRENYRTLLDLGSAHPAVEILSADAGWSAVLRVPSTRTEEEIVLDLIARDGILVHPGYFFDFDREAFMVVSLLPEVDTFRSAAQRIMERVSA